MRYLLLLLLFVGCSKPPAHRCYRTADCKTVEKAPEEKPEVVPFTPEPIPVPTPDPLPNIWPVTVQFEFDADRSTDIIALTSEQLQTCEVIKIDGHACEMGPENYNLLLSQRRAAYMKEFVRINGFEGEIITEAFGESRPVEEFVVIEKTNLEIETVPFMGSNWIKTTKRNLSKHRRAVLHCEEKEK